MTDGSGGWVGGGFMPKIETNSREEMGIQVKLNRGIQQEAKTEVMGVTAGRLKFCHASNYGDVKVTEKLQPASEIQFLTIISSTGRQLKLQSECKDKNAEVYFLKMPTQAGNIFMISFDLTPVSS